MASIKKTVEITASQTGTEYADIKAYLDRMGITVGNPASGGEAWSTRVDNDVLKVITLTRNSTRTDWK